jgi:hypothetical protein
MRRYSKFISPISSFLTMSIGLSRPRRRATAGPSADLWESLIRINSLTSAYNAGVAAEYKAVARSLKNDEERIINFWLEKPELLDADNFRHRYLLRTLFENCGTSHPTVRSFLDTVPTTARLMEMGVVAYSRGDSTHYRIRTGIYA